MNQLGFILGLLGNITSTMIFLAPLGTFKRVVWNRSTEEFDSLPYVCALLSASLWTYYGIIKPDGLLVATVNGSGVFFEAIYVTLFLLFAPPKTKVKTAFMVGILDAGFLIGAISITRLTLESEARIDTIGILSAGLSIISYSSPLAAMFWIFQTKVMKTKSVEYMPFFLSFSICISGATWTIYAILVRDYFVGVSNGAGFVMGAAQLILYCIYRNGSPSKSKVGVLEEQWQPHEPLIQDQYQSDKNDDIV